MLILCGSSTLEYCQYVFENYSKLDKYIIIAEDGLLRSIGLGFHKFIDEKYIKPLSFIFDDLGYHFSIHYPTRIELMLNNSTALTLAEKPRARKNIDTIRKTI